MTIYDLAEVYDTTIINIVQEIKLRKLKKYSDKEISEYEQKLESVSSKNKKTQNFINRVKKNIESNKYSDVEKLMMLDALDDLQSRKKVSFKTKKGTVTYEPLLDYSWMKNTLNKMKGLDFYYRVSDGFSKYKVKRSEILKMEDNSFFINKMKEGVQSAIEKTLNSKLTEKAKYKKIQILQEVLLPIVEFNELIDSHGREDLNLLDPQLREEAEFAFSKSVEKSQKNGKYPILVQIFGNESIEI